MYHIWKESKDTKLQSALVWYSEQIKRDSDEIDSQIASGDNDTGRLTALFKLRKFNRDVAFREMISNNDEPIKDDEVSE